MSQRPTESSSDLLATFPHIFRNQMTGNRFVDICDDTNGPSGSVISLFTGAGGMEIGLEKAGFQTAVCVEIDRDSRETLRRNRPNWAIFEDSRDREPGDIRAVSANELLLRAGLKYGEAALVTGGAPCQPYSNMGKKLGSGDPRNGDLFLEFAKIVLGTGPRGFIFENVAGIAQDRHGQVIDYMREQFAGSGYEVAFEVMNAADYGVPQQRKRFIMLGRRDGKPSFPCPTHSNNGSWAKSLVPTATTLVKPWRTVSQTFDELSAERSRRHDSLGMAHAQYMVERMALIPQGKNFKVLPLELRPKCWQTGKHQGQDTFGRMEAEKPAPTIRTAGYNPTKGKYIHPFENRGLNTAEMAALQSFPEDWVFHSVGNRPSIVSIGRQIGNAVPPPLSEAIGRAIFM